MARKAWRRIKHNLPRIVHTHTCLQFGMVLSLLFLDDSLYTLYNNAPRYEAVLLRPRAALPPFLFKAPIPPSGFTPRCTARFEQA